MLTKPVRHCFKELFYGYGLSALSAMSVLSQMIHYYMVKPGIPYSYILQDELCGINDMPSGLLYHYIS